jgi:hypothetical protein
VLIPVEEALTITVKEETLRDSALGRVYRHLVRIKASKGEPQEWNRDEISSEGYGGSKASRG